jgi:predicted  nucleic acid-binding Zn-ribbon protein
VALDPSQLQSIVSSTQSAIGNFTQIVNANNELLSHSADLGKTDQQRYAEHLDKMAKWNKAEDQQRKNYILQLNKQQDDHAKAVEALRKSQTDIKAGIDATNKALYANRQKIRDAEKAIADAAAAEQAAATADAKKAAQDKKKAAQSELKTLKTRQRDLGKSYNDAITTHKKLGIKLTDVTAAHQKLINEIKKQEAELGRFSVKDVRDKVFKKMGGALVDGVKSLFGGLSLTAAAGKFVDDQRQIMATAGDNIYSSLEDQIKIAKLGLTPKDYLEMNAASRQTILAAGGAAEQMRILDAQSKDLKNTFGSVGQRTKYVQGQMDALARAGIKPTLTSAGLLNNNFKHLQKLTGMTGEQFNELTKDFATDADIQSQLRSLNEEERKQMMAGITARYAENRALGMLDDQARAVAKSMAKQLGEGPLERIKKAAKLRMVGAAMGIEGAEDAAQIKIKGKRATDDEMKRLQDFETRVSNAASKSQVGSLAGEIFTDKIIEKSDQKDVLGPDSQFNTNLAASLAVNKDSLATQREGNKLLQKIIQGFDVLKAGAMNPLVGGAASIVGGAAEMVGQGVVTALSLKYLGKFMGGAAAGGVGGAAAGGVGGAAAGGVGSLLKGTGGKLLGTVGALGMGAYQAYDANTEFNEGKLTEKERNKQYGSAAGGAAGAIALGLKGAAMGTALGPVGTLIGGLIGGGIGYAGGSMAGGGLGSLFGDDKKKDAAVNTKAGLAEEVASQVSQASKEGTDGPLGAQLTKLDTSNGYLKNIQDLSSKQVELAEKHLAAFLHMSDNKEDNKGKPPRSGFLPYYGNVA